MRKIILFTIISALIVTVSITSVSAQSTEIPSWVKGVANFWAEGNINDNEFGEAISFLIEQGIIKVDMTIIDNPEQQNKISQLESENTGLKNEISSLKNKNSELNQQIDALQTTNSQTQEQQSPFDLIVINCSPYGTKSIKVEYSVKSNHDEIIDLELIIAGVDNNGNILSTSTPIMWDIVPGQTKFDHTYIDNSSGLVSCTIGVNGYP